MEKNLKFSNIPIDNVVKYWDQRPCNLRHSPSQIGTQQYFDEVEARKYLVEPHIPAFAQFDRWKGKRVLEIGCGIGTDTINFARAGAQVTAVDLSSESLALARKRAVVYGFEDKISFYQADAEQLSTVVSVERYDLVYSFGVIHHTPHPPLVIEQIKKYIDGESTVKIMVYHRNSWKVFWILMTYGKGAFWKLDEMIARNSEAQTGCPVTYTYSMNTVKELLNGLEVYETSIDHIFPYRISDYKKYIYVKEWYFRWMPQGLFRLLEKKWGWHLCVTARLKKDSLKQL
ncbi:MAG: class I SAM-dependent methyltransferase [Bacteroidetes bacterium]|nr:class I SAM-dependent methyltransferase [Bacteroidota bacterium]